jgi:tetratricopeptide repeat protein 21B
MISIYLNRGVTGVSNIQSSITIVQKLLLELQSMSGVDQKRLQVINGYIHLYLGKTEVALKAFSEVLVNAKEYVPALLGLTKALLVVDPASNKARTVAKRITKLPYDAMYREEFESSYLLLAEIYVQREKFDLAQELGNRVLKLNKSSAKAWEINGSVMELRGSYDEAANIYDKVLELM